MGKNLMYENQSYLIEQDLGYSYITNKKSKSTDVYSLDDKNLIEIYIDIIESAEEHIWHDDQLKDFIEREYEERAIIRN